MIALKIDFDGGVPADFLGRVGALFAWCGGRPAVIRCVRSHARGYHITIYTRAEWARAPLAVVAAQAILGSDPLREMFNLMRAVRLDRVPAFWRRRHRWNTLYRRKL